ncbi:mucin-5B-like [Antrostomus carolinensis]|uniref:mucin-5B-like n=1 Tax=Antrostomus carolinensis TaxID=279965 RepID=UPI0010A98D31|nr:mucin-5B-like [Antrostomus carolinensis]
MQEKFPIFILIAAGVLDLSGAPRNEHRASEVLDLSFPGETQPRAESSPVPTEVSSVTEDNLDQVTFNFQSPFSALDPTSEMTADFIPVHTETATKRTTVLPKELVRNLEVAEQLQTEPAAVKLQDERNFPGKVLSSISIPVSAQGSQAIAHLEQPDRSLQGKAANITEAGFSPTSSSAGLPQPLLSRGTHQDPPKFTANPVVKQMEVPGPKMILLTSTVNFQPPQKEIAASPFPTRAKVALESARVDGLPAGAPPASKRLKDTNPHVQPDGEAGVTPAYLKKTRSTDAEVTASAFLQKPASGDLDAAYSRLTQPSPIQFSPILSLKQETTSGKAQNSATAVINGSGHPAHLPALQTLPQGNVHSSSLLMHLEALVHGDLLLPPFQGPIGTTVRQQPLSLSQTLNCTKHVSQETNRTSPEITVLVLQRATDHQTRTSKPEKSPESPQPSANLSSLSQSWISTIKLSQTTKDPKGATSALFPGISAFENAALQPVSTLGSVHAGLQAPGTSFPAYVGLQLMGTPTSPEKGLHIPPSPTSTAPRSQVQGSSAHPVSQEAFPMIAQMSTVEGSKRKESLPPQRDKTGSPPLTPQASPVPSPSGVHDNGNQKVPLHSFSPSASHIQQSGSLAAFASKLPSPHAQGSQSSSTTAHPEPAVPSVSEEIPAYLAQALAQRFGQSHDAATKNLRVFRGDQFTMLPSSPYLSFLLKSTNGMICLQPMQDSPLPTKFLNASVGVLVSIQQILAASNSSVLDLANLENPSPSSLILVKPVFVLLPTDRPDLQMVPSPAGEGDHKTALLFTNKQDLNLGTPESSHDIPMKTSSSYTPSKFSRLETTLSTASDQQAEKTKVTSQPVLTNPNYAAITSSSQALASAPNHLLDPGMKISAAVQAAHFHRLPGEMQVPAPKSQGAKGTHLLLSDSVSAEPFTSTTPPLVVSAQHSPRISPEVFLTTEKPHSFSVMPLLSAKGLPDFLVPAHPPLTITGAVDQVQHSKKLITQTTGHHQGSVTTPSSVQAQCTDCLTLHSTRTIKHPLKTFTSITPLQFTLQSLLSTESLQKLPSQVQFVPSTSSVFSVLPDGHDRKDSAAGSTASCSGGVAVCAKAAQAHTTAVKPELTKHLEFTPIVPKPFIMTERTTIAPVQTPFSTKVQVKATVSGKLLSTITRPRMYTNSPASPASPAPTHAPLLSALKRDQIHRAPTKLFSQANTGESTKPTEISTSARKIGTGKFLGTSMSLSAMFNTRRQQPPTAVLGNRVGLTPVQPSVSTGPIIALARQPKLTQSTSRSPLAMTSLSTAKNDSITASLTNKKVSVLPTSTIRSAPSMVLLTAARVNKSTVVSTLVGKSEDMLVKGDAPTAIQLPTQPPMSSPHQASARHPLENIPLEDNTEYETGQSSPDTVMDATGPSTTKAFSVSANRIVNKVTNQSAAFNKIAANDAEMLLARDLMQFLPTSESPSYSSQSLVAVTPQGNSLLGVANTGQSEGLFLNTEAEDMARTNEVTEEAAEGLVTVLALLDSEPSALLSEARQRRVLQSDAAILNGFAVVSDDVCGSGNYTVQMSLRPAAEADPEVEGSVASQETFLALIAVQSNSSQPMLQIRSCCVTPSASAGGPGAMCCLFHRLPFECRHIQLLQSSKSRAASFTIQLFQMLNHSVAYLHCELNVCQHGKSGCEQVRETGGEPLLQPSDRNSYGNLHNLISFGPVLRMKNKFIYKPVEGPDSAMLIPILLGSLTGFAVLGSAFISLWLHHRQKAKNTCYPLPGEIHGL